MLTLIFCFCDPRKCHTAKQNNANKHCCTEHHSNQRPTYLVCKDYMNLISNIYPCTTVFIRQLRYNDDISTYSTRVTSNDFNRCLGWEVGCIISSILRRYGITHSPTMKSTIGNVTDKCPSVVKLRYWHTVTTTKTLSPNKFFFLLHAVLCDETWPR